jgi:hypothetical protein
MPSAYNWHPEFGYLCPSPVLRRKAGYALPFLVFGAIAAASSMVVQMADPTPVTDGRSTAAAIHAGDSPAVSIVSQPAAVVGAAPADVVDAATPETAIPVATAASPDAIVEGTPSHLQDTATQTDSAQAAPVAPPEVTATKPSRKRVAGRKSTRSAQNRRRDQGWYNAYAWQPAYHSYSDNSYRSNYSSYQRGSGYGRRSWRW